MRSSKVLTCLTATLSTLVRAQIVDTDEDVLPTLQFKTVISPPTWTPKHVLIDYQRPMSYAPRLNVTISGDFSPGFVFLSPYQHPGGGPYIFDKFGNLVWDGFAIVGPTNSHNFHMCNYQGENHLCAVAGNQQKGFAVGHAIIVNTDYQTVKTVQTGGKMAPVDMHEFQLIDEGKKALVSSYEIIPFDLSDIQTPQAEAVGSSSNISTSDGLGWLIVGAFQEIDVETGAVNFEWYANDHVDPSETDVGPGPDTGDGLSARTPFDYFHINSIDKSSRGNYIISARHVSTIYYINGTSRDTIWQLNCHGGKSSYTCLDGLDFAMQHDARIQFENDTHTVFSMFNNGGFQGHKYQNRSSGMIISVDHEAGEARMISQQFAPTSEPLFSDSQGNTQILPNGNQFHGWGNVPWLSEHNSEGDPLFLATYTDLPYGVTAMNYRAFSFDGWQSTPANTVPKVYSYAYDRETPNRIYVSWNGATTVETYNYYGMQAVGDDLELLGSDRRGRDFEHLWIAPEFYQWVMVEAVGPDGTSLRNSSFQPTFVPSQGLRGACNEEGCSEAS